MDRQDGCRRLNPADPLPDNLSPQALRDLVSILRYSRREWGEVTANRTRARLLSRCRDVAAGRAIGHRRMDIPTVRPVLFLTDPPFIIAYHPETRIVLRILHGARDFGRLFP